MFPGLQLEPGDALVLVSDGVTGYLDERDFASRSCGTSRAQDAAERLVAEAVAPRRRRQRHGGRRAAVAATPSACR